MPSSPPTPLSPSAHTDTFCRDRLPPGELWPVLRPLPVPARLNCATELLDVSALRFGQDRPCLRTPGGGLWTYGDLLRRSNRIARVLTERYGLVPGNRVLLRGPNNPWLVASWFAVLRAGGVVVTSVPLLRAGEVAALAEVTRPDLALCDHRWTEEAEAGLASASPGTPLVRYGDPDSPEDLIALARKAAEDFAPVPTAPDDVALLAPTSGTTGQPKATAHFHRDVLAVADTFSRSVLRPLAADVFAGTPPLGFTYGLGGQLIFPLRVGASVLLLEQPTPDALLDAAGRYGASVLFTAPTAYRAMLAAGPEAARALGGYRRCVSAGEPLPRSVWEEAHRAAGTAIIDGIGSTELLHIFLASADEEIRPGSTGRVVPGYRARVQDEEGVPVPDGTPGLLAVQGPTGCRYLGQAGSAEQQRAYVRDGWNLTGDTYVRDPDGYFWFQARSDDMIVSAGYNIAGPEVEAALTAHPEVLEAAVVAAPDALRGQVAAAYVVLAAGAAAGPEKAAELQAFAKERIAPYKYPRIVRFVDRLPRTSTGKIQRYLLRRQAAEQAERPERPDRAGRPGRPEEAEPRLTEAP
ncbi:AMP-binding protein [Phaeacidiphilus oryzae]|uniref:AMP-binding protein n=1 Tax=Phaeacidiphilus oryzae TaxID=348818 RepID=UPI0007C6AA30|nr:AMP-binding protein [Phaeacidiphilus oryzae]